MRLTDLQVRLVHPPEEASCQTLMQTHHYPKLPVEDLVEYIGLLENDVNGLEVCFFRADTNRRMIDDLAFSWRPI